MLSTAVAHNSVSALAISATMSAAPSNVGSCDMPNAVGRLSELTRCSATVT